MTSQSDLNLSSGTDLVVLRLVHYISLTTFPHVIFKSVESKYMCDLYTKN